jgi:hypothetical protein
MVGIVAGIVALFSPWGPAPAHSLTLAWDPVDTASIASYNIYCGNASRQYIQQHEVQLSHCTKKECRFPLPDLADGKWFFAVTAVDIHGLESEFSNEASTVLPHVPKVLFPDTEAVLALGCRYRIQWAHFPESRVRIGLLQGGVESRPVASSAINDGDSLWKLSKKYSPGADYRIQVSSGGSSDDSDFPFRIAFPTVLQPSDGARLFRGSWCTIEWDPDSFCGPDVQIRLFKGRKKVATIAESAPNSTGQVAWQIPESVAPGPSFRVQVRSRSERKCKALSPGSFAIE